MAATGWHYLWRAVSAIEQRNSRASFGHPGIYIVTTVGLAFAAVLVHNDLRFTERNAIFVATQPLFLPAFVVVTLVSIYLALQAALSSARERDLGTLEVLLYGPVNATAFILGKFLAQLKVYAGLLVIVFVWVNLVTWILNLAFSPSLLIVVGTSILTAAVVIAFGLLTASLGGRARNTLIYFVLGIMLVLAFQAADIVISEFIPIPENATGNDPLLIVRRSLADLNRVVRWISPFVQLEGAMTALTNEMWSAYFGHAAVLLVQLIVMLAGSIVALEWKGTRG